MAKWFFGPGLKSWQFISAFSWGLQVGVTFAPDLVERNAISL